MNAALLQTPFVQTALPLMFTILIASGGAIWANNKGFDGLHRRIDDMRSDFNQRFAELRTSLESIDKKLNDQGTRITRLEAEMSPLKR